MFYYYGTNVKCKKVIKNFFIKKDFRIIAKIKIMRTYKKELEFIASDILDQNAEAIGNENKPNYTNRDFMNCLIIFQTALMDKMYDNQEYDKMSFEDRINMANQCGLDLRKLIHTYTGLDTHKIENFI